MVLGALITTHKLDVMAAAGDLFGRRDELASVLSEVSCISKENGQLVASGKDALTSGLALAGFVPQSHWAETKAEVLLLGAGGAAAACSWYLLHPDRGANRPARMTVTDIDQARLAHLQEKHRQLEGAPPVEYLLLDNADKRLAELPAGSLVINATGLGKDRPGSPLSDDAVWPGDALAWEFNYRGELSFLKQARRHAQVVEDGWRYFIYGWTQVMGEVFHIEMPTTGPAFEALCTLAAEVR